jgi:hypothetical protein
MLLSPKKSAPGDGGVGARSFDQLAAWIFVPEAHTRRSPAWTSESGRAFDAPTANQVAEAARDVPKNQSSFAS